MNKSSSVSMSFILLSSLLMCSKLLKAQSTSLFATNSNFIMSSVGSFANSSNNSPAIHFKSTANCIDVQSGIKVLNGKRANGQFSLKCEVALKFNSLGLKLYPNPAITSTTLHVTNIPPLAEVYNICIWTTEGSLMNSRKETGYNLLEGININVSDLPSGTFVLRIESANTLDALKFIKAQ